MPKFPQFKSFDFPQRQSCDFCYHFSVKAFCKHRFGYLKCFNFLALDLPISESCVSDRFGS